MADKVKLDYILIIQPYFYQKLYFMQGDKFERMGCALGNTGRF